MNDIELVNKVFDGLIAQGGQSLSVDGECLYRSSNGRKCGAGQLIPDEDYDPSFEGACCYVDANATLDTSPSNRITDSLKIMAVLKKNGYDPEIVRRLQYAHDSAPNDDKRAIEYFTNCRNNLIKHINNGIQLRDIACYDL